MFKRSSLIIGLIIFVIPSICFGKIWQLNNNIGVTSDFSTLQQAHDSTDVQDGDTLYVAGSPTSYGILVLTRPLHIIGPGYFLNENSYTNVITQTAKTDKITFNPGSDGSSITSMSTHIIYINTNNIKITRNIVHAFYIVQNTHELLIHQNYIKSGFAAGGWSCALGVFTSVTSSYFGGIINNCIISNNIFSGGNSGIVKANGSILLKNNIFLCGLAISDSTVQNNIQTTGTFTGSGGLITNNIGYSTGFGTQNGNQSDVDMSTVFEWTGSTDGKFQLKEGSPAIGAGTEGTDCGIFGGADPYVLSGLPPMPAIYYYSAPPVGTGISEIPVRIKVKTHN